VFFTKTNISIFVFLTEAFCEKTEENVLFLVILHIL